MVVPGVKQEDVEQLFPKGVQVHEVPSGKVRFYPLLIKNIPCSLTPTKVLFLLLALSF
jgi:hypothetical protein